ncbi:unnamed protein product [Pleuronectes platessa]|uniref:Uncharacterized protein n=1 Tax=Pleuronectes platessa TaxID=8262 RepID=A0A9N7TJZ1_PLEPL|nr:unnamed protein product [Pleuronectes platessa]
MPAILVASKMKSGLPKPKPVHSARPIPQQTPSRPAALALSPAPSQEPHPFTGAAGGVRTPPEEQGCRVRGWRQHSEARRQHSASSWKEPAASLLSRLAAEQENPVACLSVFVKCWPSSANPNAERLHRQEGSFQRHVRQRASKCTLGSVSYTVSVTQSHGGILHAVVWMMDVCVALRRWREEEMREGGGGRATSPLLAGVSAQFYRPRFSAVSAGLHRREELRPRSRITGVDSITASLPVQVSVDVMQRNQ